jgi:hypothetical protein
MSPVFIQRAGAVALVVLAAAVPDAHADAPRQSRDDAWWTGPLLAPGAGTLPRGHFLIEPYFYDAISVGQYDGDGNRTSVPRSHTLGSQSYLLYGLTDSFTLGLMPKFGYHASGAAGASSHVGVGDVGLVAQYGLTRFHDDSWIPAMAINVSETLPTGKYDSLGDHPSDGLGAGAFTTSLSLYAQSLFWMPTGRILRMRVDLTYAMSSSTDVRDVSVYGTAAGFQGRARPGSSFVGDIAWEYNLSRHWVLALDVVYQRDSSTEVHGQGADTGDVAMSSGASSSLGLAPAVEYNFTSQIGVIFGAKLLAAGRNTGDAVIPVTAINVVL